MSTQTRYIIEAEGIFREQTTRQPIEIEDRLIQQLCSRSILKIPCLDTFNGMNVSATITTRDTVLTVWLPSITLNTTIKLLPDLEDGSKVCAPSFGNTGLFCKLEWKPGADMRVGFTCSLENITGSVSKCWLYALDLNNRFRRLPLPNVFDGLDVCMGDYKQAGTILESFHNALNQFANSPWNSDLLNRERIEGVEKLFRFKLIKDGFEQLPVPENWVESCPIVGNDTLATRVML